MVHFCWRESYIDMGKINSWIILYFAHSFLLHQTQGDCALEIGITPAFRTCLKDYTSFQAKMSEEGLLKQGIIIPLLCSEDSKKAIKCMMEYYFQCPDVISNTANTRKLLKEFETRCLPECTTKMGSTADFRANIEEYKVLEKKIASVTDKNSVNDICSDGNTQTMLSLAFYLYECPSLQMYIGGSNTAQELSKTLLSRCNQEADLPSPKPKTCPNAMRCVLLLFTNYVQVFFEEVKSPYRKLQKQVGFFCGKTGNLFKQCLRESLPEYGSCDVAAPMSRTTFSHVFSLSHEQNQSTNGYLEQECSAFPEDFGENQCLVKQLKSRVFLDCLKRLDSDFISAAARNSCEYLQTSLRCLSTHVTVECGQQYFPAFQRAIKIFPSRDIRKDCLSLTSVTPGINPSSRASVFKFQLWCTVVVILISIILSSQRRLSPTY